MREELPELTFWTRATWRNAVSAPPFDWTAVYDGNLPDRPCVGFGAEGGLLWHELVRL